MTGSIGVGRLAELVRLPQWAVEALPSMRPSAYRPPCPTCGDQMPGLLALCRKPGCLTAFLDDDARYDQ